MGVVGAAVGIILVVKPETRDYRISPYFWVLLAMALFELLAFARGRGAPGTAVTMDVRVSGFLDGDRVDGGDTDRSGLVGAAVLITADTGPISSVYCRRLRWTRASDAPAVVRRHCGNALAA